MVDSTNVLCPLFDQNWDLWYHLWTKCEILIHYRNGGKWLYWSSLSNVNGCTKALCPFHSSMKVLSPAVDVIPRSRYFFMTCNVDYLLLVTHFVYVIAKYRDFVNNSHSTRGIKSTNVLCPHNGIYDLCIFVIFSKKTVLRNSTFVLQTINMFIKFLCNITAWYGFYCASAYWRTILIQQISLSVRPSVRYIRFQMKTA